MAFGCLASLTFYAAVLVVVLMPNGSGFLVVAFTMFSLAMWRWLRSDEPFR